MYCGEPFRRFIDLFAVLTSLDGFPAASEDENFTIDVEELSREILFVHGVSNLIPSFLYNSSISE